LPASAVTEQVEVQAKYQGYIERQNAEVNRRASLDSTRLPTDVDYESVRGLSVEAQQKLNRLKPETIGQAARISGITPAAISLLLVHLKRGLSKGNSEKKSA
jgi:tRNA uridine 5-carboxymethylaminomethyl modification enzyme